MKHLRTILLYILSITTHAGWAQSFDAGTKKSGIIITNSERLEGNIDVSLELNQVFWSQNNTMRVVGASQVKEVVIAQQAAYAGRSLNDQTYLFEILAQGRVTIYYRAGILKDEFTNKYFSGYFSLENDRLVALDRKKDFLDLMGDDSKWMSQHIKNQDLDFDSREHIIAIFKYYNQTYEATHPSP